MVRAVISRTKILMLRESRQVQCNFSSRAAASGGGDNNNNNQQQEKSRNSIKAGGNMEVDWAPHPRTGIYVPKGHEWVMDDVPENAASFNQTYWLRNDDGVEKPDPDITHHDRYLHTNLY